MKLPFKIAARFLKSNKGQTILIILGISIGVAVQVFIGLLIQGLQKSLVDKTIGASSHITISNIDENKTLNDWESLLKNIEKIKTTKVAVPTADASAFVKAEDSTKPILFRGFDLEKANKIYKLKEALYKGSLPSSNNEVIIGKELAENLGIILGDTIDILIPQGTKTSVKVVGLFDLKIQSLNKTWVISTLETSQNIFSMGSNIKSIEIQVKDNEVFNADSISSEIKSQINRTNIRVDNWKVQNAQLLSGLNGQSISSIMIQIFVIISVMLGIASVLAIAVAQKSKQLGILKAMGIKDKEASLIFIFEGLLLGIAGAIIGIVLGLLLCFSFTKFAVNPDGTPVVALYINDSFILFSGVLAILSAVVAAFIPANRSSKLDPIEVIRNG